MTEFVAELGANHNGDFDRAVALVNAAADIGCAAVKLQYIVLDRMYANLPPFLTKAAATPSFTLDWLANLRLVAAARGLRFGCSVFDWASVARVAPSVDFLKVSSYSILDLKLFDAVAATKLPVVVGTGMASDVEIWYAVRRLQKDRLTLLHCVSQYPVQPKDCHLANIGLLRRLFACDAGWSDHSAEPAVVKRAAGRWRATMVECHLDLDGGGTEYGGGHCWLPDRLCATITDVRASEVADGTAGKPIEVETDERLWRADPSDGLRPSKELRSRWTTGLPHTTS